MTSEDKPGWFGRLFGRKGKDEVKEEVPATSPRAN